MRSVSIWQRDMKQATIPLGFEGENEFTEVRIDCKKTFDQHPDAVPSMTVTDPAGNKYPAVVTRDGDVVVWQLTAGDLTTKGYGEIQIEFLIDGIIIGKTDIARTRIERSIFPEGEAPEPMQNWLDEANQTLAEVEEAKQAFPAGGTTGQVLTKKSDEDYDTDWETPQGGGGTVTVDDELSDTSTNPVQNKVITEEVTSLREAIVPVEGFMDANDLDGNVGKRNLLLTPYALSDMLDNSFIKSDGTIGTSSSYKAYMVSPLIAVSGAGLYGLKVVAGSGVGGLISGKNGFGFYASDGETPVTRTDSNITSLGNELYTLNVPQGVSYVRFTVYKNQESYQERALGYFNQWIFLPDATADIDDSFFVVVTPKANGSINKLYRSDNSYLRLMPGDVVGKKILVFGDSIWGNDRTNGVADFLAEYSGATIYNCAIGGTWICGDRASNQGAPEWKAFDGAALITAKLTNTWTDQDLYVGDVASYAEDVLTLLKSVDMSEIDIVILSYGTNDFSNGKTATAIASAYEDAIEAILTDYPRIRILLCSPAWRMFNTTDADVYENANNETLRDVVDAIVEMAKENHVEALDMLHHCPWRALTKTYYLDNDEVHPNTEGNKVYAHVVNGKLLTMY